MANSSAQATINPAEAAHFGALAEDWWNPKGSSAMLHRLNPVRLSYIRHQIDAHWRRDSRDRRPLDRLSALDVGCGAGLLCEPLRRLGAAVTGVDAAVENIAAAKLHAEGQGLEIQYHAGELAELARGRFDIVTAMEVVEHVSDPAAFVGQLAERLAPDGLMILSTPNRTTLSKLLLVEGAERLGMVPRGTHDWDQFLRPEELAQLMNDAGLEVVDQTALSMSPSRGFKLGGSDALNYLMTCRHAKIC